MRNYRSQSEDSQVRGPDQTCNSIFGTEVRQVGKAACEDSLSTASGKMWLVEDLALCELFVSPLSPCIYEWHLASDPAKQGEAQNDVCVRNVDKHSFCRCLHGPIVVLMGTSIKLGAHHQSAALRMWRTTVRRTRNVFIPARRDSCPQQHTG